MGILSLNACTMCTGIYASKVVCTYVIEIRYLDDKLIFGIFSYCSSNAAITVTFVTVNDVGNSNIWMSSDVKSENFTTVLGEC